MAVPQRQEVEPLAYSVADARRLIGIGKTKTFELLANGRLERTKVGRRTLVTAQSIRTLIAEGAA